MTCVNAGSQSRRRATRRNGPSASSTRDAPDSKSDLSVWAEKNEALSRAEAIVRALPEEQQIVFALFEVEGWTGAEIADAMQVPLPTIHSRLRLARESIKKKLEEVVR